MHFIRGVICDGCNIVGARSKAKSGSEEQSGGGELDTKRRRKRIEAEAKPGIAE